MGTNTENKRSKRAVAGALLAIALVAGLAACGTQGAPAGEESDNGIIKIVTATNVYANIAQSIGGERVQATALITSTAQDPHAYEASAHDKLAVSDAGLVIENGGGYDAFLHSLAHETGLGHDRIINAVEIINPDGDDHEHGEDQEHHHSHGEFNEHVWYSAARMEKLSEAITEKLSVLRPDAAAEFTENNKKFTAELGKLRSRTDSLKAEYGGRGIVVTEPTPLYLLEAMGFEDRTPPEFSNAVEAGQEVSALILDNTRKILKERSIALLADTLQTETAQTKAIADAARQENIPIVNFSETIPDGKDYLSWMNDAIDAVTQAVR